MENDRVIELLSTDIYKPDSVDYLVKSTLDYLQESQKEDWYSADTPKFNALCKKIVQALSINYSTLVSDQDSDSIEDTSQNLDSQILVYRKKYVEHLSSQDGSFLFLKASSKFPQDHFDYCFRLGRSLEEQLLEIFSSVKTLSSKAFSFYDLYSPDRIDFQNVQALVEEAISIIWNDPRLPQEAKLKIINHLREALNLLARGNATSFWGSVKEIIFVLGAIGSIAGAVPGYLALSQAQQKLEQAIEIAEQTTIYEENFRLPSIQQGSLDSSSLLPSNDYE